MGVMTMMMMITMMMMMMEVVVLEKQMIRMSGRNRNMDVD